MDSYDWQLSQYKKPHFMYLSARLHVIGLSCFAIDSFNQFFWLKAGMEALLGNPITSLYNDWFRLHLKMLNCGIYDEDLRKNSWNETLDDNRRDSAWSNTMSTALWLILPEGS